MVNGILIGRSVIVCPDCGAVVMKTSNHQVVCLECKASRRKENLRRASRRAYEKRLLRKDNEQNVSSL